MINSEFLDGQSRGETSGPEFNKQGSTPNHEANKVVNSSCEHPIASTDGNLSIQLALAGDELLIKSRKGCVIGESRKTKIFISLVSQGVSQRE